MDIDSTFNTKQVLKILDVQDRRFRYWDSINAFSQYNNSIGRPGKRKEYDFRSIVEAGIIREFDNNNIAVTLGKRAVKKLKEKGIDLTQMLHFFLSEEDVENATQP